MWEIIAKARGQDAQSIGDEILRADGILSYVLFFGLIGSLAVIGVVVREIWASKNATLAEREVALVRKDEEDAAALRAANTKHTDAVSQIMAEHANEIAAMNKKYEAAMERILGALDGYRGNFQRLYDLGKDRDDLSAAQNAELARAVTHFAGVVAALPSDIQLMLRTIMKSSVLKGN